MWKDIVITIANILLICQYLWGWQYLWEYLWSGYLKSYIFRRFRSDPNSKFTHDFKDLANFVLKYPEKLENSLLIKTEKRLLEKVNQSFQVLARELVQKHKSPLLREILKPEYIEYRSSNPPPAGNAYTFWLEGDPDLAMPCSSGRGYAKEEIGSTHFQVMLLTDVSNCIKSILKYYEDCFNSKVGNLNTAFKWIVLVDDKDFAKNLYIEVDRLSDHYPKRPKKGIFAYKISIRCNLQKVNI